VTTAIARERSAVVRLGLRENASQFALLVGVNAFVGAMVGMERSILPAIADREFHLAARTAVLSFIVVFGLSKAITNYLAGRFADHVGRKHVLVAGWLIAVPVPFMLMWGPSWNWILGANLLLGTSQGLTWSTTVIMKIDLVGPARRGLAMGLNEFAGYVALAGAALATGSIAAHTGLRPDPFISWHRIRRLWPGPVGGFRPRDVVSRRVRIAIGPFDRHHPIAEGRVLADDAGGSQLVDDHSGWAREQSERRHGVGPVPRVLRSGQPGS
jgi:MFS family permease